MRFTVLLAVICLTGPVDTRQDPPQQVPLFRTRVDLVVLDVSVLDKDRRPIRGLTPADFTVLEDGVPQRITMFSAIDLPDPEPASAPWMREIAPDVRRNEDDLRGQIVVLVLDDANAMEAADLPLARRGARSVIDRLGPDDLAAVVFVADARSGQELTRDRARLLAAVERFTPPAPQGVPGALEMLGPTMALRTLKGQAEALADLPARRKAVILISTRGAAVPDSIAQAAAKLAEGDVPDDPDDPAGGTDARGVTMAALGEFGDFVRAAERANLAVYALDPGGLRAPTARNVSPLSAEGRTQTTVYEHAPNAAGIASLQALSVNTGGFAIVETNDPVPGIEQVFRENRSYYLLAYASANTRSQARFRSVRIRVNRPGVTVRSRRGYFEPERKREERGKPAPSAANAVLAAVAARPDVPMQIAAAPFAVAGRPEAVVAVVVRVQQAAAGPATGATLHVKAFDYLAKERGSERIPVTVRLRPDASGEVEYEVLSRLDLKPGRYQLRVAAVENRAPNAAGTGGEAKTGSVYCDLDVPDFAGAPLSLSGLVLSAPSAIKVTPEDRLASLVPIVPTTGRRFVTTDNVTAFLRVHQGRKAPATAIEVATRITDARNAVVFERAETFARERFSSARGADYRKELPLATLAPGEYVLTIEARGNNASARRDVRFVVEY